MPAADAWAQQNFFSIGWPTREPEFVALEARGWVPPITSPEASVAGDTSWLDPKPLGQADGLSASFAPFHPTATSSTAPPRSCPEPEAQDRTTDAGPVAEPKDKPPPGATRRETFIGRGGAVWYALPGKTASGEPFDPDGFTAGHRTLPFGSKVRVVNERNGRSVVVRINDRGPVQRKFVIDLSRGSAKSLGISGTSTVVLYLLDAPAVARTAMRGSAR
jgi:rare lipoprotein A